MFSLETPFEGLPITQIATKVSIGEKPHIWTGLKGELRTLLESLLSPLDRDRCRTPKVLEVYEKIQHGSIDDFIDV